MKEKQNENRKETEMDQKQKKEMKKRIIKAAKKVLNERLEASFKEGMFDNDIAKEAGIDNELWYEAKKAGINTGSSDAVKLWHETIDRFASDIIGKLA